MKLHGSLDNYIAMHRERHGLSQGDLAKLIGVEQRGMMSCIETGIRRPGLVNLIALELAFGAPASELFRGVAERAQEDVRRQARALLERLGESRQIDLVKLDFLSRIAQPDDVRFIPICEVE